MAPVKRCRADSLCRGKIAAMEFHGEVGSLSRFPVSTSTTVSSGFTIPAATILKAGESDAEAGSQPIPSAPISALAARSRAR